MPSIASAAASKVVQLLSVATSSAAISAQNVSFDLAERSLDMKYPAVYVYCQKIANLLREKFRSFSGKLFMVVEVRLSQDRLEELEKKLQMYVDTITRALDQNRGDWGQGMFYTGGYEAEFAPVKRGGKNFIQVAKITFEVQVSA
jgi:hypothetical protein